MTDSPTLVLLHGVGEGHVESVWRSELDETLTTFGYPTLESIRVIAPTYAYLLRGTDDAPKIPPLTIKQPNGDAARQIRRGFERRTGALELRLGRPHHGGTGNLVGDAVVDTAVATNRFRQAHNYVNKPAIRASVLKRILDAMPPAGRVVIVAHSLGSVIAADLLRRLPNALEVVGLITIGSPLANGNFNVDNLTTTLKEPPANLGWWVNFWNAQDPVSAQRGASSAFPWMLDYRINTASILHAHDARQYLRNESVGEAIGFGLFGSKSKEIAIAETGVETPLDTAEHFGLLALRYATLISTKLEGDTKDRYEGALRRVQAEMVTDLVARRITERRPVPASIARLSFDFSDPLTAKPDVPPAQDMSKADAVVPVIVLAAENLIRPFEISVEPSQKQAALEDLTAEMGLGSKYGADVFAASKKAHEVLTARKLNFAKVGALGAGAAALIVLSGGIALAAGAVAGAGLAGAAAITSALAAFGPGGMIGGLLTAGALVTAGTGGVTFGLASSSVSAATVEEVIERQLATVILRQRHGIEQDRVIWQNLVALEAEVRREHERMDEFSDQKSATLANLERKITAVERALKYLNDNNLSPIRADLGGDVEWTDSEEAIA